jgi:hypothetical protein
MGAYGLKLEPMHSRDLDEVETILKPLTGDRKIRRKLKEHIKTGLCRLIRDDKGDICALALSMCNTKAVSLSYYWVREDKRRNFVSLYLFMGVFPFFEGKEIFIYSKNIDTFKNYVEKTNKKNIYKFIGLLHDEKVQKYMKEM